MNHTFSDLKRAWDLYNQMTDGPEKENMWKKYCEIRDALEEIRKNMSRKIINSSEELH